MIRNFFSTPNIIGRLMIVLLFAGGVVFAGAFDGFVVETEATSCCGGETDVEHFSSSSCCNDDDDDDDDKCGCCDDCDDNDSCPDGQADGCGDDTSLVTCASGCSQSEEDGCYCTVHTVCGSSNDTLCETPCIP